jgi:tetratricopeptide (TPR) repeat protein
MTKREKAAAVNEKAIRLEKRGRLDEAVAQYQKAAALDPRWSAPLYNLGLLYKRQRDWERSLDNNRRATALNPADKAAWWNLGIAATALGAWDVARAAWRGFGAKVPDGEGPIDFPCGVTPIRLNPDGHAEVVWAHRIDPARAVLDSIPFPESGHRWRDLVLNDGAPNGYRLHMGKEVAVFDELQLLERSAFGTYVAEVKLPDRPDYVEQLARVADQMGGSAEDWSTSTQVLCKACSEGRPHAEHEASPAPADGVHRIAIAARDRDHASDILYAWESDKDDVHVESLDDALPAGNAPRPEDN